MAAVLRRPSSDMTTMRGVTIKSARELDAMRKAGRIVAKVIARLMQAAAPGVSTRDLDRIARRVIREEGGEPSFLGYTPYPGVPPFSGAICTSLNEEVVHGIPGSRVVRKGDLLKLDVGAVVDGMHGDAAVTVAVGEATAEVADLIETTRRALEIGIEQAQAGNRVGDISAAIEAYVRPRGYELVREYGGHGIGRHLHEPPRILNYGRTGQGLLLRPGMTVAIEPMVNLGSWETSVRDDGWTVATEDGSLSAHFEHTLAITENGPEVLTGPG